MPGHDPHGNRVFFLATGLRAGARVFAIAPADVQRLQRCARRLAEVEGGPVLRVAGSRDGLVLVVLEAGGPMLAGWRLAAVVEHHQKAGPVLRAVSDAGARLNVEAFDRARCSHCGLERRRARTFVLVHERTREVRQVGSGCLADFTGTRRVQAACRHAEQLARLRGELEQAQRPAASGPDLEEFAAHAARVIRAHGWQPRNRGTGSSAEQALTSWRQDPQAPGAGDRALARGALQWAAIVLPSKPGLSEFERRAITAARTPGPLGGRERGLVCALIAAYRQRRARSQHQGRVGEWVEVSVLVEDVQTKPSRRYGTVHRCALIDHHANRLVWWQTTGPPLRAGRLVHLRGRVAKHTHIAASQITVLSGCRPAERNLGADGAFPDLSGT